SNALAPPRSPPLPSTTLFRSGIRVIVAGTDTDFRGEPFGAMPQLLAVAEVVDKLHAICVQCGNPASRNQRLIGGRPARYDSPTRSEEHTSELQSRSDLVCRLL